MDKRWWLAVLCCALFGSLKSQIITGVVNDSLSGHPLPSATVTLLAAQTNKTIKGSRTNDQGQFTLNNIPPGKYLVTIASIGYRKQEVPGVVVGTSKSPLRLKTVSMSKEQQTLKSVTVTAPAKLLDYRIDKMVYNAEKDLSAQTGVATDLLKKVPQVSVDVDGNVELSGSSSIRFLINGKPSTAFGSNIAEVLQSIPASQIKSIEVITSPGARYDAQGLGGIINIILKRNTARGINSSISLTAGTLLENGSLNVA
ncbi:MAG: TonB-dependent receptor, partial [Chitinophagaceae bacterium]|nr:TonB-dependent receptor [Chitinophagaceae bacterium]